MDVSALLSTTVPQGANAAKSSSASNVDYQSFLKLLVAQMRNQDPTSPMDSTEYIAQLASFSQVEQSVQMNAKLDRMLQASALSEASAIIGKTLTSADGEVSGVVASVKIAAEGLVAVLADGKQVAVVDGVTIS